MSVVVENTPQQPDIAYQPDFEKYNARSQRRLETEQLPTDLPHGFPQKLESPLVWKGSELQNEDEWTYALTTEDLSEISQALAHFKSLKLVLGHVCQETFPLKALGRTLRGLSKDLHQGRGFFVLSGFPVDSLDREDTIICYTGVSSYVGSKRGWQDRNGTAVVHVKDLSATQVVGTATYTNEKQVFHTDNGDIVALLSLNVAAHGGWSKIASSWQVYNSMVEKRPDLIQTLSQNWPHDSFGGEPGYYERPLLYFTKEQRLVIQYFRRIFTGFGNAPRPTSIPPISEAQAEALDALEFYSQEHSKAFDFKKGDIQYINNLTIFHAREGYRDTPEKTRHLMRLWLRDEEYGWEIPSQLRSGYGRTWQSLHYDTVSDVQKFPLDPEIKNEKS